MTRIFQGSAMLALLAVGAGCGSSGLAAPFDQAKNQPMTMLRLQNYEPPPQQAAQTTSPVPLPPQLQQWLSAGASMIPPGLLPPGLLPGTTAPPAQPDAQKFHGFRVLAWKGVTDDSVRNEILELFGKDKSFAQPHANCMYPEFGFSLGRADGQPPAEMLVSLSCDQVQAFNFAWPHKQNGLADESSKRIVAIAQKVFGG